MARFNQTDKVRPLGKQTSNDRYCLNEIPRNVSYPRKISIFATKSPFLQIKLIFNLNSIDKSIVANSKYTR